MPRSLSLRPWLAAALLAGQASCLAPPPPIVVATPFGSVRAETEGKAILVADMLEDLAPKVKRLLPGSQDRSIDVWVQDELRVYEHNARPDSVRGFTLLSKEFRARRIHLQEDGGSPWYLAHELVHALIGKEWGPLPGLLEEGLADVVAEELNRDHELHIRAHRLLNASAFTQGLELVLGYLPPADHALERGEVQRRLVLQLADPVPPELALELLETSRSELHARWPEIPESYYGFAWLVVSRIHERGGIEELFRLCRRAKERGYHLVPSSWILAAAEMDLEALDPAFLASCFARDEFQRAIYLRPDAFSLAALEGMAPLMDRVDARELFYTTRPAFLLPQGGRVQLSTIRPVRETIQARWE